MKAVPLWQDLTAEDIRRAAERDPVLCAEIVRRAELDGIDGMHRPYIEGLFPQQRAFVDDRSPMKSACCSRRAGKTEAVAAWLLDGAERADGGLSAYIALTRGSARMILCNTMLRISERHGLGLEEKSVDGQLVMDLPNRHRIWLSGCKSRSEVSKFRGVSGCKLGGLTRAAIDEGQAFGSHLWELVEDSLDPTLLDQNGAMALVGTPGPVPTGYFYGASTGDWSWSDDRGPDWSGHHWTVLDNHHVEGAKWIDRKMATNHWGPDHPTYRRELCGLWVLDHDALVYPYDAGKNAWDGQLPEGRYHYAMGVDLGWESSTAFVVGCYREGHPELYLVHCETHQHLTPTGVSQIAQRLRGDYSLERIVVDSGGLGIGYTEEMRTGYGLPAESAEKSKKAAFQELMAGELRSSLIKINPGPCRGLLDEWQRLQWLDRETILRSGDGKMVEDPRFPNHLSDAALYLSRALRPSRGVNYREPTLDTTPVVPPEMAAAIRKVRARRTKKWYGKLAA